MTIFLFFHDGGHPPSWICDERNWTTHEEHLVVFITVKNLVGTWNRRSSFHNMHVFRFQQFGWKTPIHTPKFGGFEVFDPLNGEVYQ